MTFIRRPMNLFLSVAALIAAAPPRLDMGVAANDVNRSAHGIRRFTAEQLGVQSSKRNAAQEKRRAVKRRNRLRHKAHLNRKRRG